MILKWLLDNDKISRRTYRRLYTKWRMIRIPIMIFIFGRHYTSWAEKHWYEPLYHNMIMHTDLIHNGNTHVLTNLSKIVYNCNHKWQEVIRFTTTKTNIPHHNIMHGEKTMQCERCRIYEEDYKLWMKPLDL